MAQVGESQGLLSRITTQTVDAQGNQIISADTSFGASPAGPALLTQQLFGLANATFNITPPDVYSPIGGDNQVPYWRFYESSDGVMSGTAVIDATTNTWGIELTPGTAAIDDFMSFSTRSYLINDDNLSLRQKLLTVISKSGTAGGTASEWNMTLSATYYDNTDTALSTAFIGTVYDTGTWTSMSGTTTPGGSAINAAARYVDIEYKLTATAAVTGSAKVTIKSCLLQTSSGTGASQSFLVTETFTSSGSWVTPTGVTNLVALAGLGAGGGGASGGAVLSGTAANVRITGSGGGGGGQYIIVKDVPVSGTVSIGIGAGGAGGASVNSTKAAAGTANVVTRGLNGAAGGITTFGSIISITGGAAGISGTAAAASAGNPAVSVTNGWGGTAGLATSTLFGFSAGTGRPDGSGGAGGNATSSAQNGRDGGNGNGPYDFPYIGSGIGNDGGTATSSGTAFSTSQSTRGTAVPTQVTVGGGGGGATSCYGTATNQPAGDTCDAAGYSASGAGGRSIVAYATGGGAGTIAVTGGDGGAGQTSLGGGGGAGGACAITASTVANYNARAMTATSGKGGDASSAIIVIAYIA